MYKCLLSNQNSKQDFDIYHTSCIPPPPAPPLDEVGKSPRRKTNRMEREATSSLPPPPSSPYGLPPRRLCLPSLPTIGEAFHDLTEGWLVGGRSPDTCKEAQRSVQPRYSRSTPGMLLSTSSLSSRRFNPSLKQKINKTALRATIGTPPPDG